MIWKYLKMLREYPSRKHIGEELRSSEVEKRITTLKSFGEGQMNYNRCLKIKSLR